MPGKLVNVGSVSFAGGGCVSNVGLALARLGVPVRLLAKVGRDHFGEVLRSLYNQVTPGLADHLIVARHRATSYSVVLQPPGVDRTFLHCPGVNDSFKSRDIDWERLAGVKILHFGYPPLMRHFYGRNGAELATVFSEARRRGMRTSLDMSLPDPESEGGRLDWAAWLAGVLPLVDFFLPSLDELAAMLDPQRHLSAAALARQCLELGAGAVIVKLGTQGLLMLTQKCEQLACPIFAVDKVAGTTGSGDATIAGFLAHLLDNPQPSMQTLEFACAVGACSVEQVDGENSALGCYFLCSTLASYVGHSEQGGSGGSHGSGMAARRASSVSQSPAAHAARAGRRRLVGHESKSQSLVKDHVAVEIGRQHDALSLGDARLQCRR